MFASGRVVKPVGPMSHPKLYVFHTSDRVVVYVGSSNFAIPCIISSSAILLKISADQVPPCPRHPPAY
jgi:HKD family nuclease